MNYPVINLAETGKRIKWLRKRSGYSVSELQEFFGFEHPNAIYKWQKGESLPTVDNLLALSVIFKISMNDILVFDDQDFCLQKGRYSRFLNYRCKILNQRFLFFEKSTSYNSLIR